MIDGKTKLINRWRTEWIRFNDELIAYIYEWINADVNEWTMDEYSSLKHELLVIYQHTKLIAEITQRFTYSKNCMKLNLKFYLRKKTTPLNIWYPQREQSCFHNKNPSIR